MIKRLEFSNVYYYYFIAVRAHFERAIRIRMSCEFKVRYITSFLCALETDQLMTLDRIQTFDHAEVCLRVLIIAR